MSNHTQENQALPQRFFLQDDGLERYRYAQFLKNLILNCERYKRNSDSDSYVIAVNSAWGTGKSFFFDMFHNFLLGREAGYEQPDEHSGFHVVRYNAWKSDFWGNAFEPFLLEVTNSPLFQENREKKGLSELFQKVAQSAGEVVYGYGTKVFRDALGDQALENIRAKWVEGERAQIAPELQKIQQQQLQLKQYLGQFLQQAAPGDKLVVIVDELDRCKPTFAIQTLEIVKHFLDVPGVVFLFALDVEQLSHSVRTVYGQGMDATGYICRFFDYISSMPQADADVLVHRWIGMEQAELEVKHDTEAIRFIPGDMEQCFLAFSHLFRLSLRDLDTLLQNYRLMYDMSLGRYSNPDAHYLYAFLMTLKYKCPGEYAALFHRDSAVQVSQKYSACIERTGIKAALSTLINQGDTPLRRLPVNLYDGDKVQYSTYYVHGYTVQDALDDSGEVRLTKGDDAERRRVLFPAAQTHLNYVLFAPDLAQWSEIQNCTLFQYLQRQLETFDFWDGDLAQVTTMPVAP